VDVVWMLAGHAAFGGRKGGQAMGSEIVRRRRLWYAAWAGAALWVARVSLLPGAVRGARVIGVSGAGPFYALLGWSYGAGARPLSIIFDLEVGGAAGSVTTDGEAIEAEIPLPAQPAGPYRVTATATYRILGITRTRVTTYDGTL
jgi:hypothetical protein